ncbi:MAG: alpha/beta hydrolase [Myxococcota bacterium]
MWRCLLVATLLLGGITACLAQLVPREPARLEFRACDGAFECAELRVPIDRARPRSGEIPLAVLRARATLPAQRIGVLLVNPGGPGISAVDYLRAGTSRYGVALRERFDLIAFDTRGSGASAPLDCHDSLEAFLAQDPTPQSDAEWQGAVEASRALAEECARKHAALLPFTGTRESAADMDALREALGEERISYLGFSYGTALGASYASRFPERVRAMVLDGSVEPSFELLVFAREQAVAVEGALDAYDEAAAAQGWNGVAVLEAVTLRAERAPLPSVASSSGDARAARSSDILYGSVEALTDPDNGWRELAFALGSAQSGDGSGFISLSDRYFQRRSDGSSGLRVEAQLAVLCADLQRPASLQAYRDALPELERAAKHIGVANLSSHLPCAFWPEPARPFEPPRARDAHRVLVIAGSADPLTPHVWGERLAARLAGSTLLSVETREHTAFGRGRDCVDQAVVALLLSGEAPASPPVCR